MQRKHFYVVESTAGFSVTVEARDAVTAICIGVKRINEAAQGVAEIAGDTTKRAKISSRDVAYVRRLTHMD